MPTPAPSPVPAGMSTATTALWFNGNGREAIAFYQRALGAELVGDIVAGPDGRTVMHSVVKIGNSQIMIADAWPQAWEHGPRNGATAGIWLYVDDCDAVFQRAQAAGCSVELPLMDAFWGDRMGKLKDPFGHCWAIASLRWILTAEEMTARQREFLESMRDRAHASGSELV